jgi:hypothetical protein
LVVVRARRRRRHGDAAAIDRGASGAYNVAGRRAVAVADWLPALAARRSTRRQPRHVPVWLGRLAAGAVGVSMMTRIRGASNAKAKRGARLGGPGTRRTARASGTGWASPRRVRRLTD